MSLPTSYLTSIKNLEPILTAMQQAKAPERFTVRFLESMGFKGNADRLAIGVFKAIGLLDDQGKPTDRYFRYLDQTQSAQVLAEGIEDAYSDLFQVNKKAYNLDNSEIKNKMKTISQGQYSESVINKMAMTFTALAKLADFQTNPNSAASSPIEPNEAKVDPSPHVATSEVPKAVDTGLKSSWGGLHYNIQLILPESRDPKVYEALFKSLKEHLS